MSQINDISGVLIKSGKFQQALRPFAVETFLAISSGIITQEEYKHLILEFGAILLNPDSVDNVNRLGNKMIRLVARIPGYIEECYGPR